MSVNRVDRDGPILPVGQFDSHIGIDYSGADTPTSRLSGIQVYAAHGPNEPTEIRTPAAPRARHWTRKEVADWLVEQIQSGLRFIVGIDHAFSFPHSYFERYGLKDWDDFLADFIQHWPTHHPKVSVDSIRKGESRRTGSSDEYRIVEKWSSSAKSVFRFDVQGQVAKSTHAGIPWLYHIRKQVADRVHFWPFDGWELPRQKPVIAEVYPSIFRNRYPRDGRNIDEQDAYSIARWLRSADERGILDRYARPPLTEEERRIANLEGWILGIA